MALRHPAKVVWLFTDDQTAIAEELLDLASVLEDQGVISNWSQLNLVHGQDAIEETRARVASADVVMVLTAELMLPAGVWQYHRQTRWVPVYVRDDRTDAEFPPWLSVAPALPRDRLPLLARPDRKAGLRDVIRGLQEIVAFRATEQVTKAPGLQSASDSIAIGDVFQLGGPPTVTFVTPPRFDELKFELRSMGGGLIVEGPSRVGKSTAVLKAMESLADSGTQQIWWDGRNLPPLEALKAQLLDVERGRERARVFIDDFHYVDDPQDLRAVAFAMKGLADQGPRSQGKLVLIGINPLGGSLIRSMPDLAGRVRIMRLDIERDWQRSTKIAELISKGELAANVRFTRREEFVVAAGGSFYLAQFLCNRAAVASRIYDRPAEPVDVTLGPADVITAIQEELAARFRAPLLEFAAFDAAAPPRGAGLTLLWLLARSPDGFFQVREARLRFPMLGPAFDWFLESNLSRCFKEHPLLQGLLFYQKEAGTLTMEDPQLKFYLRELDWEEFARASGHGAVRFHRDDGPVWPTTSTATGIISQVAPGTRAVTVGARTAAVLHLSDLHLDSMDQATLAYSQLAADLRQLAVETLDGFIVSGDLVNRAEPSEYEAARYFVEQVMKGFDLTGRHVTLVPGNHDVSWLQSKSAYALYRRADYRTPLVDGAYIDHGEIIEVRDEAAYANRFEPFAKLYKAIKGDDYPLAPSDQATFDVFAQDAVLVLGLNSAWQIDHHHRDRAGIHPQALASALDKLGPPNPMQLRMAVFHHPIHGGEDSRIRDDAFLQRLAVAGFRVALHGHVHRPENQLYRYDRSVDGRQIEVVGAGTFGAPTREWVPGYPLQYNLLRVGPAEIVVETRCREEVTGAWRPDARWSPGPGRDPLPRYSISR